MPFASVRSTVSCFLQFLVVYVHYRDLLMSLSRDSIFFSGQITDNRQQTDGWTWLLNSASRMQVWGNNSSLSIVWSAKDFKPSSASWIRLFMNCVTLMMAFLLSAPLTVHLITLFWTIPFVPYTLSFWNNWARFLWVLGLGELCLKFPILCYGNSWKCSMLTLCSIR